MVSDQTRVDAMQCFLDMVASHLVYSMKGFSSENIYCMCMIFTFLILYECYRGFERYSMSLCFDSYYVVGIDDYDIM